MTEDQAKNRFLILSVVRFLSVALALFGMAILQLDMLGDLSMPVGGVFMVLGVAEFFLVPVIFKNYWQKKDR